MDKIKSIDLSRYRNNEHAEFHELVKSNIDVQTPETLGITKLYPAYAQALEAEKAAIDVESGSPFTSGIDAADTYRDELYSALVKDVTARLTWYEPEVRAAAARIKRIISQVGNVRNEPYAQESNAIASLVSQLTHNYADDVELCGETTLLAKLKEANDDFVARFDERNDEEAERLSGNVREARVAVDTAYKNVVTAINGLAAAGDETVYAAIIAQVNELIDYYKNMFAIRKGRADAPDIPPPGGR